MKIFINDNQKISAVQKDFSVRFPFLKLEFYAEIHKPGQGSLNKLLKQNSLTFGECRTNHNSGTLTITPDMTVSDLEQQFGDIYGLGVQVFRKSGETWLQTTVTDDWTLQQQNAEGRELSQERL